MIRRPPRSTQSRSSAASDVYKRQMWLKAHWWTVVLACIAAVVYPALNAIGSSAGNGALHAARHVFADPTPSHKAVPTPPLAVTTLVSYSDALAIALDTV